ncbi:MAG TPA: hypothetical protein VNU84_05705 [Candidatus Acidoferrum sp.]|jgi:hypothetical protein|nr:hypothetical protein [Candidatus Acidoferrum sp.]
MKIEVRDYRTLGVLWLVYGCLRVVVVAALLIWSGTLALMWGSLLNRVPNPLTLMTAFHVGLVLAVAWCIISAFFSFVAGVALMRRAVPAPMDTLVAALLALPDLPFGIILGVYTIAALLPRASIPQIAARPHSHIVIPLTSQGTR